MDRANGFLFRVIIGVGSIVAAMVIFLQFRSGSWEGADAIGGALGIHLAYLVPTITLLLALRAEAGAEAGEATTRQRVDRRWLKYVTYAAFVAVVLGAAAAIFVAARGHDEKNCQPDAKAELFPTPAGSRSVKVLARVEEESACGHPLWFVLQIHDVNGHSEFYPRQRIKARGDTDLSVTLPLDAKISQRRSARVYEVNEEIDAKLQKYAEDGGAIPIDDLVQPPCSGCAVSDDADLPYKD